MKMKIKDLRNSYLDGFNSKLIDMVKMEEDLNKEFNDLKENLNEAGDILKKDDSEFIYDFKNDEIIKGVSRSIV